MVDETCFRMRLVVPVLLVDSTLVFVALFNRSKCQYFVIFQPILIDVERIFFLIDQSD